MGPQMLNIDQENEDNYYRYKMPPIQIKVEGKAGNPFTIIENLSDISNSLKRSTTIILKFFSSELGTKAITEKQASEKNTKDFNRFKLVGRFNREDLQDKLYSFINNYVLCERCRNPETFFNKQKKVLNRVCFACGHKTNTKGKLSQSIIKNIDNEFK